MIWLWMKHWQIKANKAGKVKKIWVPTENDYTIQILYRLGIKWPFVSEEYIYKFIKYLDDLDFFSN